MNPLGGCGACCTIIAAVLAFFAGVYIIFFNLEAGVKIKSSDIDTKLATCLNKMPGLCVRKCIFSVEQMGFNWGKVIPTSDRDCVPTSKQCCCQIDQTIQTVRTCQARSSCATIDQGVQKIGCLANNELPLVSGNVSKVCNINSKFVCDLESTIAPEIIYIANMLKKLVGWPVAVASVVIFFSGFFKFSQHAGGKFAGDWENLANVLACCGGCLSVIAFVLTCIGVVAIQIPENAKSITSVCNDPIWETVDTSLQCDQSCKTAITGIMNGYTCVVEKNKASLIFSLQLTAGSLLVSMFCMCIGCCITTPKRKRHAYVPVPSGTMSAPGQVARSGGVTNPGVYRPPIVQEISAPAQGVPLQNPVAVTVKQQVPKI
jgi:hypothetical protein